MHKGCHSTSHDTSRLCKHHTSWITQSQYTSTAKSAEYGSKNCTTKKQICELIKCLEELHWLQIQYRINFKVVTLVFRCIHGLAPSYLEKPITLKKLRRQGLKSEHFMRQLEIPRTTKHTFTAR